ncbi:hypothetical protein GUITHDRAFT_155881 [Guillardia theta CCMP2712]|uniref:Uncharacterized protein n=1 Tax=Guillardia theta (strain CCMP2712) TaxID=905079 RepID=L1ICK8_GUITC|nr:hypothetical protein GUITHDRAFT_155881 [Guillardia theta CCMP2712]EKX33986.1 hypothetical protein GUITHDRAFT_155881 [Guillardia theta CCMP2712]|eukprot:XP_005820966.1 hypothetical protein GUITHDRAFT_155881 [Guillardia theta CCMP2712]
MSPRKVETDSTLLLLNGCYCLAPKFMDPNSGKIYRDGHGKKFAPLPMNPEVRIRSLATLWP